MLIKEQSSTVTKVKTTLVSLSLSSLPTLCVIQFQSEKEALLESIFLLFLSLIVLLPYHLSILGVFYLLQGLKRR